MLSDLNFPAGAGGGWVGAGCPRPPHLQEAETPPRVRAQETPRQVCTQAPIVLLLMRKCPFILILGSTTTTTTRTPTSTMSPAMSGCTRGSMILTRWWWYNDDDDDDDDNNDPRTRRLSWPRTVVGSHSTPAPGSEVSTSPPPSASPGWDTWQTQVSQRLHLLCPTQVTIFTSRRSVARGWVTAGWSRQNYSN